VTVTVTTTTTTTMAFHYEIVLMGFDIHSSLLLYHHHLFLILLLIYHHHFHRCHRRGRFFSLSTTYSSSLSFRAVGMCYLLLLSSFSLSFVLLSLCFKSTTTTTTVMSCCFTTVHLRMRRRQQRWLC
jgi:hypothetical protein